MSLEIHSSWKWVLGPELDKPYWHELSSFVADEYGEEMCFPKQENILRAFDVTPFDSVKVVILGQDPYHTPGIATGMCFSIPEGVKVPPSIKNIFKEIKNDIGDVRTQTDLTSWAMQGILLLNCVLTVRAHLPWSHYGKWWEVFTDKVIQTLSSEREHLVFILWGNHAISKASLIDDTKHLVITSSHPSPFSARKSFFGSRPFSRTNGYLRKWGMKEIEW